MRGKWRQWLIRIAAVLVIVAMVLAGFTVIFID